jgi:hypothetical protein
MADVTEIKDLDGQIGVVTNDWVIAGQRNGLDVRRKFKGISTCVDIDNKVQECIIYYFEQELYPNHTVEVPSIAKTLHKAYHLKNIGKRIKIETTLAIEEGQEDVVTETEIRDMINTLNTYISDLGQNGIVNPVNSTLADLNKLPLDVADSYVLNSK